MPINMKRNSLPASNWSNAGLFFDKGFSQWVDDNGERGEQIGKHIDAVCKIPVPEIYQKAYTRWLGITQNDNALDEHPFQTWFGKLEGRLFIGLGGAHVLETQVTRHPVYGIPLIPGSALKGLARARAKDYGLNPDEADILFGKTGETPESMDCGYLIFHDAWWIPDGGSTRKPYVREIVTVHATEYYKQKGDTPLHNDMESPNPNHQLAVQGSFYFVIEGLQSWAKLGMDVLKLALQDEGIGGKVAAGYGYFKKNEDELACTQSKKLAKKEIESIRIRAETYTIEQHAEKEQQKISDMGDAERETYQLNTAYNNYQRLVLPETQDKDALNGKINNIIKSGQTWTQQERQTAAEIIQKCYEITLTSKRRTKKLQKLAVFISGGSK